MPRRKKVLLGEFQLEGEEEEKKLEETKKKQRLIEAQKARERRANQTPEEIAGNRTRVDFSHCLITVVIYSKNMIE
jgi:hypothetical protein